MFDSNIGAHCSQCNMRDYLPMKCADGCGKPFCKDCFKDHVCPMKVKMDRKYLPVKKPKKRKTCSYPGCKTIVSGSMGIKCNSCNKKICITHRHAHYDKCKSKNKSNSKSAEKVNTDRQNKCKRIMKWPWGCRSS